MALAFSLEQLCAVVDPIRVEGSTTAELSNIASLDSAREGDLAFLGNEKYHAQVASCNASAILVPADYAGSAPKETVCMQEEISTSRFTMRLGMG